MNLKPINLGEKPEIHSKQNWKIQIQTWGMKNWPDPFLVLRHYWLQIYLHTSIHHSEQYQENYLH